MTPVLTGSGGESVTRLIHFKINRVEGKKSLFEIDNILPVCIWEHDTAYIYVLRMRIITKPLTLGFTKGISIAKAHISL